MLSIVYLSTATTPPTDAALSALLQQSRANNTAAGLSGVLLYRDGRFIQVLEGPEEAVRAKIARIEQDPRHSGIRTLAQESIDERRFGDWSMGYRPADDDLVASVPGFTEYLDDSAALGLSPRENLAASLLHWFRAHPLAAG